jgi:tetratricopeptide (TPR) repeat protein
MIARLLLAALAFLLLVEPALSVDPLGTAGSFRRFGWASCDAPIVQRMRGACDPAPVDPALAPAALVRAHVERAVTLVSLARMEEAGKAADAAVAADPKSIEALTFRGRLLMSMLRRDAAERDLNAGLMLEPRNPVLLASRAELLLDLGETAAAMRDITAAMEGQPDSFDAFWIRARIHTAQERLARAEDDLGQALRLDPSERRARLLRAHTRLRSGNFQGAIEDANRLLGESASDPSGHEIRALAYIGLERPADAVGDLDQVLGPPGEPTPAVTVAHYRELLFKRVVLLAQLRKDEEARRDMDTLLMTGGRQAVLRIQLYLRKYGFSAVRVDGQRSAEFDAAFKACLVDQVCSRGINWPI